MFTFKIFEIPDGKSTEECSLDSSSLDLGEHKIDHGKLDVNFEKTPQLIRAVLNINVHVELICDRSLEQFLYQVDEKFEVLFKFDLDEEIEEEHASIRKIDIRRNEISIKQDLLDTILVNIPAKKLHPRFLDESGKPKEFKAQTFGSTEEEEVIDPRWAALKDLKT